MDSDSSDTPRALARRETERRILEVGTEHLGRYGAAAISLRAIARDMGLVSSAVYRYVESRDELLTRLVVAAYNDLADHVELRVDAARLRGPHQYRRRVRLIADAMYEWARREPARWSLLYGSPVPGYDAPNQRTGGPGTRVIVQLAAELARAARAGELTDRARVPRSALTDDLELIAAELIVGEPPVSTTVLAAGLQIWTVVVGAINADIFDYFGRTTFTEPALLFQLLVETVLREVFR